MKICHSVAMKEVDESLAIRRENNNGKAATTACQDDENDDGYSFTEDDYTQHQHYHEKYDEYENTTGDGNDDIDEDPETSINIPRHKSSCSTPIYRTTESMDPCGSTTFSHDILASEALLPLSNDESWPDTCTEVTTKKHPPVNLTQFDHSGTSLAGSQSRDMTNTGNTNDTAQNDYYYDSSKSLNYHNHHQNEEEDEDFDSSLSVERMLSPVRKYSGDEEVVLHSLFELLEQQPPQHDPVEEPPVVLPAQVNENKGTKINKVDHDNDTDETMTLDCAIYFAGFNDTPPASSNEHDVLQSQDILDISYPVSSELRFLDQSNQHDTTANPNDSPTLSPESKQKTAELRRSPRRRKKVCFLGMEDEPPIDPNSSDEKSRRVAAKLKPTTTTTAASSATRRKKSPPMWQPQGSPSRNIAKKQKRSVARSKKTESKCFTTQDSNMESNRTTSSAETNKMVSESTTMAVSAAPSTAGPVPVFFFDDVEEKEEEKEKDRNQANKNLFVGITFVGWKNRVAFDFIRVYRIPSCNNITTTPVPFGMGQVQIQYRPDDRTAVRMYFGDYEVFQRRFVMAIHSTMTFSVKADQREYGHSVFTFPVYNYTATTCFQSQNFDEDVINQKESLLLQGMTGVIQDMYYHLRDAMSSAVL